MSNDKVEMIHGNGAGDAANEFEFNDVPKYIDFQNENEDLHEKSAFFNGDVILQPTPLKLPDKPQSSKVEKPAAPVLVEKNARTRTSSNLALFNPEASRVAIQARRRSQQIQDDVPTKSKSSSVSGSKLRTSSISAPKEKPSTPGAELRPSGRILRSHKTSGAPAKPLPQPNPSGIRRPSSRSRETKLEIDPRIRASVDRLSAPRRRESGIPSTPSKPPVPSTPLTSKTARAVPASVEKRRTSNLALFNPEASRVAIQARRRSQQIQDDVPTKSKTSSVSGPKLRSSSISAQREKPGAELKPSGFNQILRSYKTPTGKTPAKPLTQPNPFGFRRSSSRCRDTKSEIDPRIRASVDRLSAPRKRESGIASTLRR
jgi:hypothetical protein